MGAGESVGKGEARLRCGQARQATSALCKTMQAAVAMPSIANALACCNRPFTVFLLTSRVFTPCPHFLQDRNHKCEDMAQQLVVQRKVAAAAEGVCRRG